MTNDSRKIAGQKPCAVVVIPCLNEEDHLEQTITHFVSEPADTVCKIVVADGGSTDRTLQIIESWLSRDSRISLLHNEQMIQSCGVNRAVEQYGDLAPFIIRADAHADYPAEFCAKLLAAQQATAADCVVVSMIAKGVSCFQKAAAAAQNSRLGNGGSPHRNRAEGRFVDHGHHALIKVSAFRAVGGYDETFSHNEDAELDLRLTSAGYRIYLCAGTDLGYYPRKSVSALFNQYRNFGRGRAMTILKHRAKPKLRQMLPVMVAPAGAAALLWPVTFWAAIPASFWVVASLFYGLVLAAQVRNVCTSLAGVAAMAMHFGFSVGFISAVGRAKLWRNSSPKFDSPLGSS